MDETERRNFSVRTYDDLSGYIARFHLHGWQFTPELYHQFLLLIPSSRRTGRKRTRWLRYRKVIHVTAAGLVTRASRKEVEITFRKRRDCGVFVTMASQLLMQACAATNQPAIADPDDELDPNDD